MDKLIEFWIGLGCEDHDTIGYKDKELTCEQDEIVAYLISKSYGFIKWLVDNDKIDENKIEIHWFSFYESVLMELAIQDEPIEFLISILK